MNKKRQWLFRIGTLLILLAIAACMMVVGRGHTVYFDNKKIEVNGETITPPYKVTILVKGEQVAKLSAKERGKATTIGQNFEMTLKIVETKGGEEKLETYRLKLPYELDGIVINLPAYLKGEPQEVWMSEFVPMATKEEATEEAPTTDEFGMEEIGDF